MEDNSDWKNVLYEKLYKICYKESWTSFEIPVSFRKKNLTNMNINPYQGFSGVWRVEQWVREE